MEKNFCRNLILFALKHKKDTKLENQALYLLKILKTLPLKPTKGLSETFKYLIRILEIR